MAVKGNGQGIDISFKAGSSVQTTTSQFLLVGIDDTSTSVDHTVYGVASTLTARRVIGINQTYLSSGAQECNVRVAGLSKAICAASVAAGAFIRASEGATTTAYGRIEALDVETDVLTATSARVCLGRALEDGSTGTTISVLLSPAPYPIA